MNQATLDLAIRCIDYLCQNHHDPLLSDQEVSANVLSGQYSFDAFASQMWFELSCQYLSSVRVSNSDVSTTFVESSHTLWKLRKGENPNEVVDGVSDQGDHSDIFHVSHNETDSYWVLTGIKEKYPVLHDMLRSVSHFRQYSFVYTGESDQGIARPLPETKMAIWVENTE